MFRNLLATTAIAALMTTGAMAQDQEAAGEATDQPLFSAEQDGAMQSDTGFFEADASQILATSLLGMTVYNGPTEDADAVGDINDVVMGPDGNAEAVVVGVGGFLGVGEKEVAVDFAKISWVERDNARWLIIDSSREELEGAPAFDRTVFEEEALASGDATDTMAGDSATEENGETTAAQEEPATTDEGASDMAAAEDQPATTDEGASDMAAAEDQPAATDEGASETTAAEEERVDRSETAAVDPTGWTPVEAGTVSADELIGTSVHGANDEDIGEIGDVIVTADGQFEAYVVDVGGFLGIGAKPVAIGASQLQILRDDDGNFRIRTGFTQEQLEQQTAYDEQAYQENREDIILE